ncbi:hypothetical protein BH24ACT22_BH24ACT22_05720 [soil metagenome]
MDEVIALRTLLLESYPISEKQDLKHEWADTCFGSFSVILFVPL